MSPEQLSTIKAVADIVSTIGAMPITGLLLIALLAPWVIMIWISLQQNKRFESVVTMYRDNVALVEDYRTLVKGYERIVDGQQDLLVHATQILTSVKNIAENNLFCPWVRKGAKGEKEIHG